MMVETKPRLIPVALCALLLVGSSLGPAVSPPVATAQAGLRIAFESDRTGTFQIYLLMGYDGREQQPLTTGGGYNPSW